MRNNYDRLTKNFCWNILAIVVEMLVGNVMYSARQIRLYIVSWNIRSPYVYHVIMYIFLFHCNTGLFRTRMRLIRIATCVAQSMLAEGAAVANKANNYFK